MSSEQKKCENCKQLIELAKMRLHEAYCLRHNVLCPDGCEEVVQKSELEEHKKEMHAEKECKFCGFLAEAFLYAQHDEECEEKPQICPFCELEFRIGQLGEHKQKCGSKTEKCEGCGKQVAKQDLEAHECIPDKKPTPKKSEAKKTRNRLSRKEDSSEDEEEYVPRKDQTEEDEFDEGDFEMPDCEENQPPNTRTTR